MAAKAPQAKPAAQSRPAEPDKRRTIKDFEYTDLCYRCKGCTYGYRPYHFEICPANRYFRNQAEAGMGRVQLARALKRGMVDYGPGLHDVIFSCTTCGACMEFCNEPYLRSPEQGIVPMVEAMRAEMVERGLGPKKHAQLEVAVAEHRNPYGESPSERARWVDRKLLSKNARVAYFAGCTASYRQQHIAQSLARLLARAGVEFTVVGEDEWCCGSPLLRTGRLAEVCELAEHNVKALEDAGAETVVFSCAGCYKTFTEDYPRILQRDLPFKAVHGNQLLADLAARKKLRFKPFDGRVTYHDPCHLRFAGIFDSPRRALGAVPGLELVEMPRYAEEAFCCGAGGGVKSAFPDWALATARERVRETDDTGAKAIVTSCPFCVTNLSDAARVMKSPLQVYDIAEFLDELAE